MSKMMQKRERSVNFTKEETDILLRLIEANLYVLENKKSDATTWMEKHNCWKSIEGSFNCVSGVNYRNAKTLRLKYEGLKSNLRKKCATIRAETRGTGEGSSIKLNPYEIKIRDMLLSIDGMDYDSSTYDTSGAAVTPESGSVDPLSFCELSSQEQDSNHNYDNTDDERPTTPQYKAKHSDRPADDASISYLIIKRKKWNSEGSDRTSCDTLRKCPCEELVDSKLEITKLQKQILEEELENNRKKYIFEDIERDHKRQMWELERKYMSSRLLNNL